MAKRRTKDRVYDDCWNTVGVWSTVAEKCDRLQQVVHCRNCEVFSRAGREVLEQKPPAGYITQWRNEIAHQQEKNDESLIGVMTFRIGEEWFALPAKCIQEIAELRKIHRVPHSDNPRIGGIVNIGGEVNICYSLGSLLGVKNDKNEDTDQRLLVVNYNGDRYIFPVNEVSGMARYGESDLIPVPATLGEEKLSIVSGMIEINKKHIALLDVDQVCQLLGRVAA